MKKFLHFFVAFATIGAIFADIDPDEWCGDIAIKYRELLPGSGHSEFKIRNLTQRCFAGHGSRVLNHREPEMNYTFVYPNRPTDFVKDPKNGETWFLKDPANSNATYVEIKLYPEIVNIGYQEMLDRNMIPVTIILTDLLKKLKTDASKTYVTGSPEDHKVHGDYLDFRLFPGFLGEPYGKEILTQTLVPGPKSKLKHHEEVYVVGGYFDVSPTEGFQAKIDNEGVLLPKMVTIFYQKPDLDSKRFNPGYVNVTVNHPVYDRAVLKPGWFQLLEEPTKQTLIFRDMITRAEKPSTAMEVVVFPRRAKNNHHELFDGYEASLNLIGQYQEITIYYNQSQYENPEDSPAVRASQYQVAYIVAQGNQSFSDESFVLTPGWTGNLQGSTLQTLRPYNEAVDPKEHNESNLVEQRVTVTLGWNRFRDNSGFNAIYTIHNTPFPISVHLSVQPKPKH